MIEYPWRSLLQIVQLYSYFIWNLIAVANISSYLDYQMLNADIDDEIHLKSWMSSEFRDDVKPERLHMENFLSKSNVATKKKRKEIEQSLEIKFILLTMKL